MKWFLMWYVFSGPNPYDPNTVVEGVNDDSFPTLTECLQEKEVRVRDLELMAEEDPTMSYMIFCQDLSWEVSE